MEPPLILSNGKYFVADPAQGKPIKVWRNEKNPLFPSYLKMECRGEKLCLIKVDNGITLPPGIFRCDFLMFGEDKLILVELKLNGRRSWKNIFKALKQLKNTLYFYAPFFLYKNNQKQRGNVIYFVVAFGKGSGISNSGGEERRREHKRIRKLERFFARTFATFCWRTSHKFKILLIDTYQGKSLKIERKKIEIS
jgi:hypothetical protein